MEGLPTLLLRKCTQNLASKRSSGGTVSVRPESFARWLRITWCHGALSRRATYYIELLSPRTILRLVYIFHKMNVSISGYKVSLESVGLQSHLVSEACFIYSHEGISLFHSHRFAVEITNVHILGNVTSLSLDESLAS